MMCIWEMDIEKEWTLRHCQELVKRLSAFESDALLKAAEKTINMKSLLGLCSLILQLGDSVTICTFGYDEEETLEALKSILRS
ncbi:HPr family phosphocarrier protein [Ectobacillus panaciterrae]|uniref:HPr family phosphocarrier protein n=1 Tax=Ectobacillus panaciterrae TaxID=363872 RepID=UPI0004096334|nr:HPr family phosphocarrier protein [Ectobacillus panaciterrae]